MNHTDQSLADLLSLTCTVDDLGIVRYHNSEGKLHRIHGPAVVHPGGVEFWFADGQLHRDGGPAEVHPGGIEYWYHRGDRHRTDGPAVVFSDGGMCWWLWGRQYTFAEWTRLVSDDT